MSADTILVIIVIALLVSLASGNWVFVALGMAGIIGFFLTGGATIKFVGPIIWGALYNPTLAAVPLFIFMGRIILDSGLSDGIYKGLTSWLGNWPGGLLHTNVASCALFASISGSTMATTATIGTVALPNLRARGYDRKLSLGSIAASGTLGPLIPPSISMIVYGTWVECSIGQLFVGGLVPGLIVASSFMSYIAIRALRNPLLAPRVESSWRDKFLDTRGLIPIFILVALIFGAIYTGVMTPTETAAVASFLAILITVVMRRFSWRMILDSMISATRVTVMVLFIDLGAKLLVFVLTFGGVPSKVPQLIATLALPKLVIIFLLYFLYIALGCFIDSIGMIVLTMPFVLPILLSLGINLVWFGVTFVMLAEIGMLTPPMGLALYVVLGLDKTATLGEVAKAILPFLIIIFSVIVLATFIPNIILALPSTMTS